MSSAIEDDYKFWSKELEDWTLEINPNLSKEEVRKRFQSQVNLFFKRFEATKVYLSLDKDKKEIKMDVQV